MASDKSTTDPGFSSLMNVAGERIERAWILAEEALLNHSAVLTVVLKTFVVLAYHAYLAGAIYHRLETNGNQGIDWCEGVGALVIVTIFLYFGFFYSRILRPRSSAIYAPVRPTVERLRSYCDKRIVRWALTAAAIAGLVTFFVIDTAEDRERLYSLAGLAVFILFGWIFSKHPFQVQWRQVVWGVALQFTFGLAVLRWETGQKVFACLGDRVATFLGYTGAGSGFVYGFLVTDQNSSGIPLGSIFAFRALSSIFLFSFMVSLLYYYGVMQCLVKKIGWLLQMSIGTTAAESINCAANIFLGQTDSPLAIKPLLPLLTKSEWHSVMTSGFATISGSILAAYISFGISASHLLSASVMSAPAALAFAKLFYPETEKSRTKAEDINVPKGKESNGLDAAAQGAANAIFVVLNISASLIACLAFMGFLNSVISWFGSHLGAPYITFEYIMGKIFIPVAWLMGVPSQECGMVGDLVALKTIVNEFAAYRKLAGYIAEGVISKRSQVIATYALCGFSNPGSIGIQLAVFGAMAPTRKADQAQVAFRAFISGSVACFMTACIAGALISTG